MPASEGGRNMGGWSALAPRRRPKGRPQRMALPGAQSVGLTGLRAFRACRVSVRSTLYGWPAWAIPAGEVSLQSVNSHPFRPWVRSLLGYVCPYLQVTSTSPSGLGEIWQDDQRT